MKNNIMRLLMLLLCCSFLLLAFAGCANTIDVDLPIGNSNVENDNVMCHYTIKDEFTDDYIIKGWFSAESEADLSGKFVFSISFDGRFDSSFEEKGLFSFEGKEITEAKDGKLQFEINLGKLSDTFAETDTPTKFAFHFHREGAERTDVTKWSDSSYTYTYDGKTVKLDK